MISYQIITLDITMIKSPINNIQIKMQIKPSKDSINNMVSKIKTKKNSSKHTTLIVKEVPIKSSVFLEMQPKNKLTTPTEN
jgi:hypothetical protein